MQSGREPAPSARSRAECFRHSEETKASLPVAPPRVTVRNQRSCPDSRPSRRLWVSQGEDPPLSTPIDGAGNGPPVSGRPRQPGLPESGLAGTTGPAVAFGHEGSHWRHGVPCVQSAVQPPTPTNRWSPPARPRPSPWKALHSHPAPVRPAVSPHERSRGAQARRRHAGTRAAGWRGRSSRWSRGRTRRLQPGFAPRAPRFAGNAFIVLQTYLTRLRSRSFHIKAQMSWASEHLVRFPRGRLARG